MISKTLVSLNKFTELGEYAKAAVCRMKSEEFSYIRSFCEEAKD